MGTFPFRFSPETRKIFKENAEYFSVLHEALNGSGLTLRGVDPEAHSEFQILDKGKIEVTFVFPLDDNDNPNDGRIYLKDRFVLQGAGEELLRYARDFEINSQAPTSLQWQRTLAQLKSGSPPSSDAVRKFASGAARSFARPFSPDLLKVLREQADYLTKAAGPFLAVHPEWKFKLKDPQSHFVLLTGDSKLGAVMSFVVDDDNDPPNGRIFLNETFWWDPKTGKMISHERIYLVAPEVGEPLKSELAATVASLNRAMDFSEEEKLAFLSAVKPTLMAAPYDGIGEGSLEKYLRRDHVLPSVSIAGSFTARNQQKEMALKGEAEIEQRGIKTILEKEGGAKLPREILTRLTQIAEEPNSEIRHRSLLRFAKDELLRRGFAQSAYWIADTLRSDPVLRSEAEAFASLLKGEGGLALKIETLLPQAAKHIASPPMLLAMMGAAGGGLAAEAAGLRWLQAYGKKGRWLAALFGVGGEALAFTAVKRSSGLFFELPASQGFFSEVAAGALLFGAARLAHGGAGYVTARMGEGRYGAFWGGPHPELKGNPILVSPLGRANLGRWGSTLEPTMQWTRAGHSARWILNHGGAVGAMAVSSHLAKHWHWAEGRTQNASGELVDAALFYVQALAGFDLANRATDRILFSFSAEARLRMTDLQATIPLLKPAPPKASAKPGPQDTKGPPSPTATAGKTFQPFHGKDLPDVRFYELLKGGEINLHFPPEGRLYLDKIFFNQEGEQIVLERDAEGNPFLLDRRPAAPPMMVPGQPLPVFDLTQVRILHNRMELLPGQETRLEAGDELFFPGKRLRFARPTQSPLAVSLGLLSRANQMDIFEIVDRAESLPELLKELQAGRFEGASLLHASLQQVISGQQLLYHLPSELFIFPKIKEMLEKRVEAAEAEGDYPSDFTLRDLQINAKWSVLETQFQVLRVLSDWKHSVAEAKDADELIRVLTQGPFSRVESHSVEEIAEAVRKSLTPGAQQEFLPLHYDLQEIPVAGGLRQKVSDLREQRANEIYWEARQQGGVPLPGDPELRREVFRLDNVKESILERIRRLDPSGGNLRGFHPEELEELVYQVLERGRPLALLTHAKNVRSEVELYQTRAIRLAEKYFPEDMQAKISPFSGDKISMNDKETQFRLAVNLLNRKSGRPIFGTSSAKERQTFIGFIRDYLDPQLPEDYFRAKVVLRRHLDEGSPLVTEMLKNLLPEGKALILENYFGDSRKRDLAPGAAFRVAYVLGAAGMYREMAVKFRVDDVRFRVLLTLGDLGQVDSEAKKEFFLLHTHSESYQASLPSEAFSESGQRTVALKPESKSAETRHVLPSQEDLRVYLGQAKEYFQLQNPVKFVPSPFFDLKHRVFRTWLGGPMGLAEIQIQLGERGQASHVKIRFSLSSAGKAGDLSYRQQRDELEKFSRELGVPVTVEEVGYLELAKNLPYSISK